MTCGVYKICANHPEELVLYVGQSSDVEWRLTRHLRDLRKGSHDNRRLQDWHDRFDGVRTGLITECRREQLAEFESNHISVLGPLFNINGMTDWPLFLEFHANLEQGLALFPQKNERGFYVPYTDEQAKPYIQVCERILKADLSFSNFVDGKSLAVLLEVMEKFGY